NSLHNSRRNIVILPYQRFSFRALKKISVPIFSEKSQFITIIRLAETPADGRGNIADSVAESAAYALIRGMSYFILRHLSVPETDDLSRQFAGPIRRR